MKEIDKLFDLIDENELVQITREMVAIPSITHREGRGIRKPPWVAGRPRAPGCVCACGRGDSRRTETRVRAWISGCRYG